MRRNLVRNIFFFTIAVVLLAGSLIAMHFAARADQNALVTLSGQNVPLVQRAHLLGTADASQALNLSIGLRPRNPAGLANLLSGLYTPGSSEYHHYLTPAQFNRLFAPTPNQVQQVISFLRSQGFTVGSIASNSLLIDATATVAQAQQAFQMQINLYRYGNRIFYANAQPPTIPSLLQPLIGSISGLDNSVQYHPLYQGMSVIRQEKVGQKVMPSGYGPAELSTAYDTAPFASANMRGENQTVAIFELDGYRQSDVQQYFQNYNLGTPRVSNVLVGNFSGFAGQGAIEVELDMEIVGAIAPHANQLIYEGSNTAQGLNDTYNRIVTDNKAQVVSTSWGLCESSTGSAELQTLHTIFQQAAAQGVSFYAAAGDAGAYDCGDSNLAVDSPADDPYVTGVGGTNLQLTANNNYVSESVWSNSGDTRRGPKGAGSGGGVSNTFVRPGWQVGNGVISNYSSGYPCQAPSGQYCRQVPDVSADADPSTGYAVYCTVTSAGCTSSGWLTVGGTSAGAPFWAGSTALINQYLQSQKLNRLGSANAALYNLFNSTQVAPAFHDVTSGNNLYYPATTGYDMASGLGSPDVSNLARDLSNNGNGIPTPIPTPTSFSLLKNTSFENGQQPWQESSSGGYDVISTINAHSGSYSAYLCGYTACNDRVWQTFTLPTAYSSLKLSYWWFSDTTESSQQCLDTFTVVLQTASGQSIQTLQQDCNNDPTNSWQQKSLDLTKLLTPYKGQQISLLFSATTQSNTALSTDFFVDDVNLTAFL